MKLLLIDNYDSFTYNLMHLFASFPDVGVEVVQNDKVSLDQLKKNKFSAIIIGPGPGDPTDLDFFGQNNDIIANFGKKGLPILGVCLGFQGIAVSLGARLKRAKLPQHGKISEVDIVNQRSIFEKMPRQIKVMRYHSLMIDADKMLPDTIDVLAEVNPASETVKANGREIMAIKHVNLPIYGLQFHPESFATELGDTVARNFLRLSGLFHKNLKLFAKAK